MFGQAAYMPPTTAKKSSTAAHSVTTSVPGAAATVKKLSISGTQVLAITAGNLNPAAHCAQTLDASLDDWSSERDSLSVSLDASLADSERDSLSVSEDASSDGTSRV